MSSTKIVFFEPIGKTRWPPWPLIGWDIFNFCSETAERNSTKLDRKKDLNVLYQVCFLGRSEKQNGLPGQSIKKVAHCTQVHDMWPFGPLVCSYKCVIHIYWRINKKFLNNIAVFQLCTSSQSTFIKLLHYLFTLFSINNCGNAYMKLTLVTIVYWNWLSGKLCIYFTNIDIIYRTVYRTLYEETQP